MSSNTSTPNNLTHPSRCTSHDIATWSSAAYDTLTIQRCKECKRRLYSIYGRDGPKRPADYICCSKWKFTFARSSYQEYIRYIKCWACENEEFVHAILDEDRYLGCYVCGMEYDGSEQVVWRGPYYAPLYTAGVEAPEVDVDELLLVTRRENEVVERRWKKCRRCGEEFRGARGLQQHQRSCNGLGVVTTRECVLLE